MTDLKQKIDYLYSRREQYAGYMHKLIGVWRDASNERWGVAKLGHNSVVMIERAYANAKYSA